MLKKLLIYFIFTILILSIFFPYTQIVKCKDSKISIIYVDDDGDVEYKSIQNAIDNASQYHEIYVYNGTYYENIFLNKSITLIGEDKNNTIIDAKFIGDVIYLLAETTNISGFTIRNSGTDINNSGINIQSKSSLIFDNNLENNQIGIRLIKSFNNTIYHNNFFNNTINAIDDGNNTWYNNTITQGNYWDDYNAKDKNNDGIGDTPYNISGGKNQDKYPMMNPYYKKSKDSFYVDEKTVINMLFIGMFFVILFVLPIAYYWRKKYLK